MSTSIFIKTCHKDHEWLRHCLESIKKYAIGFDEVVVVADRSCIGRIAPYLTGSETVKYVRDWTNGYIQQQYVKLHADQYCSSENILFVDSDCVFHDYFSDNSFMVGRRPILLKTKYTSLEGSGAEAWKPLTEQAMGFPVEWEYMRRMPMLFKKDTITAFRNAFIEIVESLKNVTDNSFSEFNCIGAFIERYEDDKYFISDTEKWMPETVCKQRWSWGGLTTEVLNETRNFIDGRHDPESTTSLSKLRSRDDIGYVLDSMGLTGRGAEIGVAFGENAEQILSKSKLKELILIDPWDYVPGENPEGFGDAIKDWKGCYEYCRNKLHPFLDRTKFMRSPSNEVAKTIEDGSLDFVYIDANHMSPYIDNDLELWYPKVKSGGIFGGHDYHNYKNSIYQCDVKAAVDRFFSGTGYYMHVVPGQVPSWYVVKN